MLFYPFQRTEGEKVVNLAIVDITVLLKLRSWFISFGQFDCTGDWSILPLDLPSSIGRTMIKLNSLKTSVFNSISSMGSLRKNLDDQVGILNTFKEHIQKNSLKCHHGQQFGGHLRNYHYCSNTKN